MVLPRLRLLSLFCAGSLLAAAVPTAGSAQRSAIIGVVTTQDSLPLPETVLHLRPSGKQARATSDGVFQFDGLSAGTFTLIARRVGFAPETLLVVLRQAEVQRVALRLRRATLLETVLISARRSQLPRVVDREERGLGLVMYADEIKRTRAYSVQDLLMYTRLFRVSKGGGTIIVDGRPGRASEVRPADIAAIEVLHGRTKLYLETDIWIPSSRAFDSRVPIIAIWTHSYVRDQAERRDAKNNRTPPQQ